MVWSDSKQEAGKDVEINVMKQLAELEAKINGGALGRVSRASQVDSFVFL
jgi:hypothetical protein